MCLIIDANCAAKFSAADNEALPIAKWLLKKTSKLALGGTTLAKEYSKLSKFSNIIAQLEARGQIKRCDLETVDSLEQELQHSGLMKSDDPHVIAVAQVSGARVLYSNDQALHADFSSSALLKPRGSIYQNGSHAHLLVAAIC